MVVQVFMLGWPFCSGGGGGDGEPAHLGRKSLVYKVHSTHDQEPKREEWKRLEPQSSL